MKITCTNIGPPELGGQVVWEGSAIYFTRDIDRSVTHLLKEDGTWEDRRTAVGHKFVYEITDQDRREMASKCITTYYPEWRQLNIMRDGPEDDNAKMSAFIQYVQAWSDDDTNQDPFGLENVTPDYVAR